MNVRTTVRRMFVAVALVALASCGSDDDDGAATVPSVPSSASSPATGSSDAATTAPDSTASGSAPTAGGDEAAAIADLAQREGVEPSEIVTVAVDNVTWPDSSVGCPEEGMQYLQVLTDGVRIVLELDGQRYEYHAGGGRPAFYCATPQPPVGE